ncbi:MAG: pyruvate:ferredoxin (flavodoxin) oxidoreductase [Candidatus Raymondbacteria bacterium RIFOXYD12_FULL_49_13]|uniref:Pyruvate:ferredoxin (Flavodoxin) oxidoreductase n=1 Tax=Candidatus Raymondbacteria bacterium RIFOXYD12_FULL_49_13 TaxID=1817890 RepID=A0A1F7FD78_UNCRA|nr:MAG: pyruvate:ferredoxin (flavodoxin) oxidoreductase [Candidatus Raymondbacteria bacterium RIFOXYD12_FULL_49_13]
MACKMVPHDGNTAVAHVAHATNEVIAIYPITPSSVMGEVSDEKSARGEKNIWGTVPVVSELQSEGGASGAVHGALTTGALTTTFTASQGLLLMIPNMYKIAGELIPTVFHVSARSIACQALSIFGDHSDVMACRQTGYAMLASSNVQENMDFALIAQAATLESRVPFLHFFEGFRVSSEVLKICELSFDDMRAMIDPALVHAHRARGLNPFNPMLRGTSQNPDVYFQGRETVNKYYDACPAIVEKAIEKFAAITGRKYGLFEYYGTPDADRVVIVMGCGSEVCRETAEYLNAKGEKVGVVKVRLYRPFSVKHFVAMLPKTVKKLAVLDRTKEPGSLGEPLYEDVRTAIGEAMHEKLVSFSDYPVIIGGRYGLGSKEFTPGMAKAVFDELKKPEPKNHFTVGINDDVTNTSLPFDANLSIETGVYRALFYGLGSDGTVGANKNSIKIIADETDNYAQGYFVYDSKKAGSVTVSHLRFGKKPIRSPYLVSQADFIACHNFTFLEKYDMLKNAVANGIFLLNSPYSKDDVWDKMPREVQKQILDKKLKFFVIDAIKIAEAIGLGERVNTIMQAAFFTITKVIDETIAIGAIKNAIKKTYGKKGENVVKMNVAAVDKGITEFHEVTVPASASSAIAMPPVVPANAPDFVQKTTAKIIRQDGDAVAVSEMPFDGTWPTGTTQYEKRNIAVNIPVWNPDTCIQCNQCSLVCPHAAIRPKVYDASLLAKAPKAFKSKDAVGKEFASMKYTLQVAPEDCTGCGTCVYNCLKKDKEAIKMMPQIPLREQERENFSFFLGIPDPDPKKFNRNNIKGSQFLKPLFEFSGACAGCGETAYVKLLTQLFGERAIIANATGCSSIYGGNLPTTPYCKKADGSGPAWTNSLFEDNAEIAMGMRLTADKLNEYARELSQKMAAAGSGSKALLEEIISAVQTTPDEIDLQKGRVMTLKAALAKESSAEAKELLSVADYLVKKSVWAVGGDGWAYDIGYGGLDHVLASGKNVNVLVLDTEVYSNTGGQASKSTPRGAVARFAEGGKPVGKKDLGLLMMSYGNVFVAKVAMGSSPAQVVKAFVEAEAYNGPSIIIAYSHCIAHGINMETGLGEQEKAVNAGHWMLYRYNPDLLSQGKNPLQLDSKMPSIKMEEFESSENRFKSLTKSKPEAAKQFLTMAQADADNRWVYYKALSEIDYSKKQA